MSTNACEFYFWKNFVVVIGYYHPSKTCLHVALPVAAFLEMLTKSVTKRATTAARAGRAQREMGQTTPFSGRGSRNAAEDDHDPTFSS